RHEAERPGAAGLRHAVQGGLEPRPESGLVDRWAAAGEAHQALRGLYEAVEGRIGVPPGLITPQERIQHLPTPGTRHPPAQFQWTLRDVAASSLHGAEAAAVVAVVLTLQATGPGLATRRRSGRAGCGRRG